MNTIDQSIFEIYTKTKNSNNFISNNTEIYRRQCLNIPFEFFVQNPIYFLNKIKKLLQDDYSGTKKLIKKYNIPREEELTTSAKEDIFQFAKNENASKESILLLKKLSNEYDSFLNNFSYEN